MSTKASKSIQPTPSNDPETADAFPLADDDLEASIRLEESRPALAKVRKKQRTRGHDPQSFRRTVSTASVASAPLPSAPDPQVSQVASQIMARYLAFTGRPCLIQRQCEENAWSGAVIDAMSRKRYAFDQAKGATQREAVQKLLTCLDEAIVSGHIEREFGVPGRKARRLVKGHNSREATP